MKHEVNGGKIVNLCKPAGWTPLQAIEKLREMYPELKGIKVACAGRLDPMAEGVLIVLAGEELRRFDEFCELDKEYEAEILFGLESDSGDVMGELKVIESAGQLVIKSIEEIKSTVNELIGELKLPVPRFSSWRVQGKPLYWWARQGRLAEIEIPVHECTVFSSQLLGAGSIDIEKLRQSIVERLNAVKGDFRQEAIKTQWELLLRERNEPFPSAAVRIHCSSGTYVRSIVQEMGKRLGIPVLLYKLVRTRVGKFGVKDAVRLE